MGAGVQGAGVGHGSLVEAAQILATGELKVGTGAGEGPQRSVNAPGVGQVTVLTILLSSRYILQFLSGMYAIVVSSLIKLMVVSQSNFQPKRLNRQENLNLRLNIRNILFYNRK